MSSFGEKVRKAREAMGLTQVELARLAGVNKDTLSRYESGANRNPGLENIRSLAKVFSVSVCDLIDDEKSVDKLYSYEEKIIAKLKGIRSDAQRQQLENIIRVFLNMGKSKT